MRFAVAIVIVGAVGTIASAQKAVDRLPQYRYASPKTHKSSSAAIAARTTNANAAELAQIEREKIKAQTGSAKAQHSVPLTPPHAQNRNRPVRLATSRPSSNARNTSSRASPSRGSKVH